MEITINEKADEVIEKLFQWLQVDWEKHQRGVLTSLFIYYIINAIK